MQTSLMNVKVLEKIKSDVADRKKKYRYHVLVCGDTGCRASGSLSILNVLKTEIRKMGLIDEVEVLCSGCIGFCSVGPLMTVFPGEHFYQKLTSEDIPEIVLKHFIENNTVEHLMVHDPETGVVLPTLRDIPFFKDQHLQVMRWMGRIDPESLDEYIWQGGYFSAAKALLDMRPQDIIMEVKVSGLRGRGGGGFPTGIKWEFCASVKQPDKFVLCNADEGDPGAFMDRAVIEATPHAVLEGMLIASKAIGASQGYIYCRAEYPLAIKRLGKALDQARFAGLLGKNIFGSGHDFDIGIKKGAGAFVCGEETALIASIEGRRGTPRPRPPFPAISGLWGKPTVLNNVETFANISGIIANGGASYAKIGTESSKGTKVFAVTGKICNIGLVEVPMGSSLRQIIFDICGGIPDGKSFKAVQLGGPSGGCLTEAHLDMPLDYDAINQAGAIMGSGGMIVMDTDTCMVDVAKYFMEFCQEESCGKCTPCRIGTRRMLEILTNICNGKGRPGDLDLLENIGRSIKDTALCGLGQTSPNPVFSTIRYFRSEYEKHIHEKKCPAGICKALITFKVDADVCDGCGICFKKCPSSAIQWKKGSAAFIDPLLCDKCGICYDSCKTHAIMKG